MIPSAQLTRNGNLHCTQKNRNIARKLHVIENEADVISKNMRDKTKGNCKRQVG